MFQAENSGFRRGEKKAPGARLTARGGRQPTIRCVAMAMSTLAANRWKPQRGLKCPSLW